MDGHDDPMGALFLFLSAVTVIVAVSDYIFGGERPPKVRRFAKR